MKETTVIHKCDHCGHSVECKGEGSQNHPKEQFFGVRVAYESYSVPPAIRSSSGFDRALSGPHAYWCRKCCEDMGLLPRTARDGEQEPSVEPKPTLEDLVREMIQDMVDESVQESIQT